MADGQSASESREATDKRLKRVQMMLPTSPTHYIQPPTPDHPPPSAMQAEKSIHERIRPLSQVSAISGYYSTQGQCVDGYVTTPKR